MEPLPGYDAWLEQPYLEVDDQRTQEEVDADEDRFDEWVDGEIDRLREDEP